MKILYIDDMRIDKELKDRLTNFDIAGIRTTKQDVDFIDYAKNKAMPSKKYDMIVCDYGAVEFKNVEKYIENQAEAGVFILFVSMWFSEIKHPSEVATWFGLWTCDENDYYDYDGFLKYGNIIKDSIQLKSILEIK